MAVARQIRKMLKGGPSVPEAPRIAVDAERQALEIERAVASAKAAYEKKAVLHEAWLEGRYKHATTDKALHEAAKVASAELQSLASEAPLTVIDVVSSALNQPSTYRPAGWAASALLAAGATLPSSERFLLLQPILDALGFAKSLPDDTREDQIWTGFTDISSSDWIRRIARIGLDIPGAGDRIWRGVEDTFARLLARPPSRETRLNALEEFWRLYPDDADISRRLVGELGALRRPLELTALPSDDGRAIERALHSAATIEPEAVVLHRERARQNPAAAAVLHAIEQGVPVTWRPGGAYGSHLVTGPIVGLSVEKQRLMMSVGGEGARVGWENLGSISRGTIVAEPAA
jgi:hypothetical protein